MNNNRLAALAESWRSGAHDLREEFKVNGTVPYDVRIAADTIESCAARLEAEIQNDRNALLQREQPAGGCGRSMNEASRKFGLRSSLEAQP